MSKQIKSLRDDLDALAETVRRLEESVRGPVKAFHFLSNFGKTARDSGDAVQHYGEPLKHGVVPSVSRVVGGQAADARQLLLGGVEIRDDSSTVAGPESPLDASVEGSDPDGADSPRPGDAGQVDR